MPEEYLRPLSKSWWLRKPIYFAFMMRELTSVFVAGYAVFLLVLVGWAADAGSFGRFFQALRSPWSVALHLVVLAMALFHTITWINLTPKVLVLWRGEEQVSPALIAASNYLAWLVVSGLVAWVALR
ncbi:MAG: fumarate reductase subunit C [Acidimicrobiia bacterium]